MSRSARLPARAAALTLAVLFIVTTAAAALAAPPRIDRSRLDERRAAIAAKVVVAGTLVATDAEARTVTVAVEVGRPTALHGTTVTIPLADGAVVARDQYPVEFAVLQAGDAVVVHGRATDSGPVADRVHATSPVPEPQPEPDPDVPPDNGDGV